MRGKEDRKVMPARTTATVQGGKFPPPRRGGGDLGKKKPTKRLREETLLARKTATRGQKKPRGILKNTKGPSVSPLNSTPRLKAWERKAGTKNGKNTKGGSNPVRSKRWVPKLYR